MKKYFTLVVLYVIIHSNTFAKNNLPRISCNYNNIPFIEFIHSIEKKYELNFFFNQKEFTDIRINLIAKKKSLDECLQLILPKTKHHFYIFKNNIFIFKGNQISEITTPTINKSFADSLKEIKLNNKKKILQQKKYQIFNIGIPNTKTKGYANISGKLTIFNTKTSIPGCNIYTKDKKYGTSTDSEGRYSLRLPAGNYTIIFSSVAMKCTQRQVNLLSNGRLDVEMESKVNFLDDIKVIGNEKNGLNQVKIGFEQIDMKTINNLPKLLGEPDIIKSTLVLPGVTTVGEGTSSFNVRGGKSDQNLILLNSAPIYYPTHFFGNFSAINADLIDNANLYKGSFPVNYGGRISSVYQLNTKKGNRKKIKGVGGISPMSSNFMIEGPIKKDKSSFILSARGTYSDWILKMVDVDELYNSKVNFYDVFAKFDFDLDGKNKLSTNIYGSKDNFKLKSDTSYNYLNFIGEVKLATHINDKWKMTNSFAASLFGYDIETKSDSLRAFKISHSLHNYLIKNQFTNSLSSDIKIHFGSEVQAYIVDPGTRKVPGSSELSTFDSKDEQALEYGLFTGINFTPVPRLKIETGIRLAGYLYLSNGSKNIYQNGLALTEENKIGTKNTDKNSIEKHYLYPEFRFSSNYSLNKNISLKLSYNTTSQFIHLLSNTTAISPTDTWKLSDSYLSPQRGHLFSAGGIWIDTKKTYEITLESFYKRMNNIKEFKAGADLLLNDHIETEIIDAQGKSYGIEFSFQKKQGKLTGRLGYTYARTLIRTKTKFEEELINNGEYFPANYDKPHQLNLIANWEPFKGITFSTMFDYSTGRPITYPVAQYTLNNQTILHYSDYNQYRIPDYFRIDASLTINRNLRKDKRFDSSWSFSVYNLTGRKNAYSVYYKNKGKNYQAYKLSIFGTAIPTVTYKFKF